MFRSDRRSRKEDRHLRILIGNHFGNRRYNQSLLHTIFCLVHRVIYRHGSCRDLRQLAYPAVHLPDFLPGDSNLISLLSSLTISVIVATYFTKPVEKMNGSQEIGTYLIYLFLFVIGVPANIMTVITKSPLFLVLCFIMVVVNMIFCFVGAKLCKASLEDAIIASNANIGGPTTAAGMAISQGWTGLVGPAMLVGVLGYVIGNYMGTIVGFIVGA